MHGSKNRIRKKLTYFRNDLASETIRFGDWRQGIMFNGEGLVKSDVQVATWASVRTWVPLTGKESKWKSRSFASVACLVRGMINLISHIELRMSPGQTRRAEEDWMDLADD